MAPAQFSTQRVENLLVRKNTVKLAKVIQVGVGKSFPKVRRQSDGQLFHQPGAILGLVLPVLLLLHDPLADQPVSLNHGRIHRRPRLTACQLKNALYVCVKSSQCAHANTP